MLTKRDEVKKDQIEKTVAETQDVLRGHPAAHPDVIFLSSHKGEGLADLRAAVARLLYRTRQDDFRADANRLNSPKFLRRFLQEAAR